METRSNRRPRGTGMVYQKDRTWMGKWYIRGTPIKRSLRPSPPAGKS
jgi:hypothetical protein